MEARKHKVEQDMVQQEQVAKTRLIEQAEAQHETFVAMSRHNMTQYTDKATSLIKESTKNYKHLQLHGNKTL
jgi:hypothetical protein